MNFTTIIQKKQVKFNNYLDNLLQLKTVFRPMKIVLNVPKSEYEIERNYDTFSKASEKTTSTTTIKSKFVKGKVEQSKRTDHLNSSKKKHFKDNIRIEIDV
jgi:hypothetical protein